MRLSSLIVVLLVLGYGGYSLYQHFGKGGDGPDALTEEERFLIEEAEREAARQKAEPPSPVKTETINPPVVLEPLRAPELEAAIALAQDGDGEVAGLLAEYRSRLETVEVRASAGKDALGLAAERKAGPELRRVVEEELNAAKRAANATRETLRALLEKREADRRVR